MGKTGKTSFPWSAHIRPKPRNSKPSISITLIVPKNVTLQIAAPKFEACALNSQLIDIYLLDYVTPKLPDNFIQISPNSKISNAWAKNSDFDLAVQIYCSNLNLHYFQNCFWHQFFQNA